MRPVGQRLRRFRPAVSGDHDDVNDFHVRPPALRDFADALTGLESAMAPATDYTSTWVALGPATHAGSTYADVRDQVERARATLLEAYAPGGPLTGYYRDAALAMHDIATDYEAVDAATRARFDELLALCGGPDYFEDTIVLAHRGEAPGVDVADLCSTLTAPTDVLVETMTTWQTVADVVDVMVSLQWVIWAFNGQWPGLTEDLAESLDALKGEWGEVDKVAQSLGSLSAFHFRASGEVGAAYNVLWENWQGLAANAAYANLQRFTDQLDQHAGALRNVGQQLNSQAWTAVMWADMALEAVNAIVDFFSVDLTSLDTALTNVLRKISKWVVIGRIAIDMLIGAVHGLGVIVESLSDQDLGFPTLNPPPTSIGGAP